MFKIQKKFESMKYYPIISSLSITNSTIKKNIFKKGFNKYVLISYIISPFFKKNEENFHSNQTEVIAITEVFNELGYSVDVVDYRYKLNINFEKYDIIFGFGDVYEKSFANKQFKGFRIYYSTGAHPFFQVRSEILRVKNFNQKNGLNTLPKRASNNIWPLSFSFSDVIIVVGNEWTASTFKHYFDGRIFEMPVTNKFNLEIDFNKKINREIVWIGSTGSIHKGLDVLLEAYEVIKNSTNLNIVGHIDQDIKVWIEEQFSGINFHGYISSESLEFMRIIEKCSYVIFPSCSEGQSGSLILAIGYGCIPIATIETGVDIELYGKVIKAATAQEIINNYYILETEYSEDQKLIDKCIKNSIGIKCKHNIKNFKMELRRILEITLSEVVN